MKMGRRENLAVDMGGTEDLDTRDDGLADSSSELPDDECPCPDEDFDEDEDC